MHKVSHNCLGLLAIAFLTVGSATARTEADRQILVDASIALNRGNVEKSFQLSNKYVERNPKDANGYYQRARALSDMGKKREALNDLDSALKLNPWFKQAYSLKGQLYQSKRDPRAAAVAIEKSLECDPCDDNIFFSLRTIYNQLGKSTNSYNGILARSVLYKGIKLEEKSRNDEAMAVYNQFIKDHPTNQNAYEYRGNLHYFRKEYKEALADYLKAIDIYPTKAGPYFFTANCYDALGDFANASKRYEQTLVLSRNMGFVFKYAKVLIKAKQYDKAIALYDSMLKIEQDNSDAWLGRGDCHVKQQKYSDALKDYTKAIDLAVEPTPETLRLRADVYEKLGQPDKARADRARADAGLR